MKKVIILLFLNALMIVSLQAQSVSTYTRKLDNGVSIKMEQCWNHVWVSQSYETLKSGDLPLALSVRTLGELTTGSSFKLYSSGKEMKVQGAKPGTYSMKVNFKLSGNPPGNLSLDIDNVVIKPQSRTIVSIIIYDFQFFIDETPGSLNGMAAFSSRVERYKGNSETNPTCGTPSFYSPGNHSNVINPAEIKGRNGKIKPGTYDILLTLGESPKNQNIWLLNFVMKPNVTYTITTNLNAGIVEYAGTNRNVKSIHLYPAGTADRHKGTAMPSRNLELARCEGIGQSSACPPGSYDVLLNSGSTFEWRKGTVVTTARRIQIK
ncbi:MAG TPA: hypothetical protein P5180_12835 [Bacteroidales bacterium]|nr:hypothetical protein [Bacteroidales bacterium]HPF02743.1 hypothetical protein [Bacteroidales bacterium]HRW86308.1 hypothetical protein [Bacteroidales bacterium]